jgi:dolichol-phosphate mannosyltransferase
MFRRRGLAMDLSVVIPVFNEQDNIAPLVAEIRAALEGRLEYELIYVDDGSEDATAGRLAELQALVPGLRVLRHAARVGQSAALMSGVRAAHASWIVTLDGDGQNDPADIPKLFDALRAPARPANLALVTGHRKRRRDTWLRRASSRVANGVRAQLLGDATPDTGCGLKLIARETCLQLPYFDHMHRFLPALVQRNGGATISVEVNHRPRASGQSKYGVRNRLWVGIVDLAGVMWLQRRMKRPSVVEEPRA